jgi:hypothetical protein
MEKKRKSTTGQDQPIAGQQPAIDQQEEVITEVAESSPDIAGQEEIEKTYTAAEITALLTQAETLELGLLRTLAEINGGKINATVIFNAGRYNASKRSGFLQMARRNRYKITLGHPTMIHR